MRPFMSATDRVARPTCGIASVPRPRRRASWNSPSCASSSMRRACAWMWSSVSLVIEVGDRRDAALGHVQVLALRRAQQLVLRLLHAGLGLGEPLVHPLVGAPRRLDLALDAVVHVDVGERVGPERGVLGVVVRDPHLDHVRLGHGLDGHRAEQDGDRVGAGERLPELELVHDALGDRARVQHVQLRVEELAGRGSGSRWTRARRSR
jgi:hypothetical protein